MADSAKLANPLRVLVSEGNSTSAREAITILGLSGHIVEVCAPSFYCLARFLHFVRRFHRVPGLRDDPDGFLSFVENLLATRHLAVLRRSWRSPWCEAAGARICSISEASVA